MKQGKRFSQPTVFDPPKPKNRFFSHIPDEVPSDSDLELIEKEEELDEKDVKKEPLVTQELVTTTSEALAMRRSVLEEDFTQQVNKNKQPLKKNTALPKDLKDIKPRGKQLKQRTVRTKPDKKEDIIRGPLTGKTFVITGVLEGIEREEIIDILKSYGGRVTGSVSKRTTFLIYGEKLEDGRRYTEGKKYQKAKELNVKIINQRQLDEILLRLRGGEMMDARADDDALAASFDAARSSAAVPSAIPTDPDAPPAPLIRGQPIVSDDGRLWTEKYAPKALKEVIGNAQAVEKLVNWVKDWEIVVLKGIKKDIRPMRGGRFDPQLNVNAKAALLSGPPGIGKTTTARLIARGLSYRAIEMNASDVRSKRAILEPLKTSSGSAALTNSGTLTKTLVIMDEVDGMSPGDRGGIGALLEVIRSTQVPIICICNDRSCTKLKTLGNVSYDIRFSRPNKTQIAKRLLQISAKEGLQIEPAGLEHLVECAGNDIRQVFTMLEMWARYSSTLSYSDAKGSEKLFRKDANVMLNNFDAAGLLLRKEEMAKRNTKERMDLFMIDFDLIPLLVYENYLTAMGTVADTKTMERLVEATESIAFGDGVNKQIRSQCEWGLLQAYGMASAIEPGLKSGFGVPFPKFPEWFSRNSSQKKNERLLVELRAAMAGFISGDDEDILTDYIPLIYKLLMQPLKDSGREGVNETLELMETYNLSPEMFKEHLIQLQFGTSTYEEEYKALPTQVKSAITRTFNTNNEVTPGPKGKKRQAGDGSEGEEEEDPVPVNSAPPRFDPEIEEIPASAG